MPLKTTYDEAPTLSLTPMIDVLFLLIIFFMVGTRFTDAESKIKLHVPEVGQIASQAAAPQKRVVHVMRDGSIVLDDQPVSLDQLISQLQTERASRPGLNIAVRGDAEGSFQNVASVLGACRQAGITNMAISVRIRR